MNRRHLSRRGLLKGALATAGAAIGTRLAGPSLIGRARAIGNEHNCLLHIFLGGGTHAILWNADAFVPYYGAFSITSDNITMLPGGFAVDNATTAKLPKIALDSLSVVPFDNQTSDHEVGAITNFVVNDQSALLNIAANLDANASVKAPIKAAIVGEEPPFGPNAMNAVNGVAFTQILDLKTTVDTLSGSVDERAPQRATAQGGVLAAQKMSQSRIAASPKLLTTLSDGYGIAAAALGQAPKTFVYADLATAYGVSPTATAVDSPLMQFLAAELMFRAGASVVSLNFPPFMWDTHNDASGEVFRNAWNAEVMPGLTTFLSRMLGDPDFNVVVAQSGDFNRRPGSEHASSTSVAIMGKYVKHGIALPIDKNAVHPDAAPKGVQGQMALWAQINGALKQPKVPLFGDVKFPELLL